MDCRSTEFPNILISPVAPIHFKCIQLCGFSCLCHFPGYLYSPALNSPACAAMPKSACTRIHKHCYFRCIYRPSQSLELLRLLFNPFMPRRCLFEHTVQLLGIAFIENYANIQTEEFAIWVIIQKWPHELKTYTTPYQVSLKVFYNL